MSEKLSACPKILVIGSLGMLARDLLARLHTEKFVPTGLDIPEIDITNVPALLSTIEAAAPDIVINCAAYTAVDKAESEPDIAFAVNRDGSRNLADTCRRMSIPLIHISTDYIFDGRATRPYREDDPPNPLGVYGQSKLEGEEAIRSVLAEHLIVRTAWLYGRHGNNFVKTMLRLAKEREELRVVADQCGCPTWTGDLADCLIRMTRQVLEKRGNVPWGTYHFCGAGEATWCDFAQRILDEAQHLRLLSKEVRVTPITTTDYPTPTERPAWSVLDCHKVTTTFGISPRPWEMGLSDMMMELTV